MKSNFFLIGFFYLLSSLMNSNSFAGSLTQSQCQEAEWVVPAESSDGIFYGDLRMKCKVHLPSTQTQFVKLKTEIENKIANQSLVHAGPSPTQLEDLAGQKWDVSHLILEDGSGVKIREIAELATNLKDHFIYQTHSQDVEAKGMAGYLTAVNFSVRIEKYSKGNLSFIFRNQVSVKRPWFALDLLFAPIARRICFQKMDQIRDQLFPWILNILSS